MKLRTIDGAFNEIKSHDNGTALTRYRIRELVINGDIPSKRSGTKWLINLEDLEKYYEGRLL